MKFYTIIDNKTNGGKTVLGYYRRRHNADSALKDALRDTYPPSKYIYQETPFGYIIFLRNKRLGVYYAELVIEECEFEDGF